MKKLFGRLTALVLVMALALSVNVLADEPATLSYVAMGDSIAAGYGVEQGYPEMLAQLLVENDYYDEVNLSNIAVSGYKTDDLIAQLDDEEYIAELETADIITVSIGGNHLLIPLVNYLTTLAGDAFSIEDLMADSAQIELMLPMLASVLTSDALAKELDKGVAEFAQLLPEFIAAMDEVAPDAELIVSTVYRPTPYGNEQIDDIVDVYVSAINEIILDAGENGLCSVIDIYANMNAMYDAYPEIEFMASLLDPHPSVYGHYAIAGEHLAFITGDEYMFDPDYIDNSTEPEPDGDQLEGLSAWALEEVTSLYTRGVINNELLSNYQSKITRGEFMSLVVNAIAIYSDITDEDLEELYAETDWPEYADVIDHEYALPIEIASRIGIINGRSDDVFDPDGQLKREECAKIALLTVMALDYDDEIVIDTELLPDFADSALISEWAVPYVANAQAYSVMSGRGADFDPLTSLSREEAMLVVERLIVNFGWAD